MFDGWCMGRQWKGRLVLSMLKCEKLVKLGQVLSIQCISKDNNMNHHSHSYFACWNFIRSSTFPPPLREVGGIPHVMDSSRGAHNFFFSRKNMTERAKSSNTPGPSHILSWGSGFVGSSGEIIEGYDLPLIPLCEGCSSLPLSSQLSNNSSGLRVCSTTKTTSYWNFQPWWIGYSQIHDWLLITLLLRLSPTWYWRSDPHNKMDCVSLYNVNPTTCVWQIVHKFNTLVFVPHHFAYLLFCLPLSPFLYPTKIQFLWHFPLNNMVQNQWLNSQSNPDILVQKLHNQFRYQPSAERWYCIKHIFEH